MSYHCGLFTHKLSDPFPIASYVGRNNNKKCNSRMKSINLLKNDVTKFVVNNETGFLVQSGGGEKTSFKQNDLT